MPETKVHQSKGIVVGEHNQIYQYFDAAENSGIADYHIGFRPLIEEKTRSFVGRHFLTTALDAFLSRNRSGYFIIEGEPGIGKTAFMAHLVSTRGYSHHFNVSQQNIRTTKQFLSNASAQLIARYKLPHKTISKDSLENSNFLVQCFEEATQNKKNLPVVLVIDAIDETDYSNLSTRSNPLYLPPVLPDGAFIILTTRRKTDLRFVVEYREDIFFDPDSKANQEDIVCYVENFVRANPNLLGQLQKQGIKNDDFQREIALKSEGNFIYLRYVLPDVANGKLKMDTLQNLPQGLAAYYQSHWAQMQFADSEKFDILYMPIVSLLAVVREPVSIGQLESWTKKDRSQIQRAIQQWQEFLDEENHPDEKKYRIYHSSFQDFLSTVVDLKQYDEVIAQYYLSKLGIL